MDRRPRSIVTIAVLVLSVARCTLDLAGGSSDQGNAIVVGTIGQVTGLDTLGVAACSVRLVPAEYNALDTAAIPPTLTAITDGVGQYRIERIPAGTWCLLSESADKSLNCIVRSIILDSGTIDTVHAILQKPGDIIIPIDSSMFVSGTGVSVHIPGTAITAHASRGDDSIVLKDVPSGMHSVQIHSSPDGKTIDIDPEFDDVFVLSGGSADFTMFPEILRGPISASPADSCIFNTIFLYSRWIPDICVRYIEYRFSWGDGDTTAWSAAFTAVHVWKNPGVYEIRAQFRYLPVCFCDNPDEGGKNNRNNKSFYSGWSEPVYIAITRHKERIQ